MSADISSATVDALVDLARDASRRLRMDARFLRLSAYDDAAGRTEQLADRLDAALRRVDAERLAASTARPGQIEVLDIYAIGSAVSHDTAL